MRKRIIPIVLFLISTAVSVSQAQSLLKEPDRARNIADMMINRDDGRTLYRQVLLVTCRYEFKGGKRRCTTRPIRKRIENLVIDVGNRLEDTIMLGIIEDPPSEKNMAMLQKDYDEEGRESDQWMYFPALKKLKRVVSQSENSPKTGSVFGSEIAYEDIEKMHLSNYGYSYEGREKIDRKSCDKIVAFPTDSYALRTSYSKEVFWIDSKTKIPLRRELYDKQGRLAKTFYRKNIIERSGVWLNTVRIVVNHISRCMSMEKIMKYTVNIPIEAELAGLRALKDAAYRESKMKPIRNQAR